MNDPAKLHHIPELDGIRGIAVLAVVLLHFYAPFSTGNPWGTLSMFFMGGWAGVELFFVLSGYLITSILLATRDAENYFSAFYARRSLRIFPLYFLVVGGYFGIMLPLAHRHGLVTGFHTSEQVWYWTFLGNWRQGLGYNDGAEVAHFWSLAIEEQFYLVFALVVMLCRRKSLVRVCVTMITTSILLRIAVGLSGQPSPMMWRITVLHLDPIAMGALLACSPKLRQLAAKWWSVLLVIGVLGIYLPTPMGLGITAAGLGGSGLVALACAKMVPLLRMAWLRSLGKYSYGMYVLHAFVASEVVHIAKRHHETWFVVGSLILGPAVSFGLAWVSWHLLEDRFQRMKARFPYRIGKLEPAEVDRHLITTS
jgi:peptidoglycan/LPS O-acetylase OafA/YrhL